MARTNFEFQMGEKPRAQPAERREDQSPMRLLIIGDWSGRASRGVHEPDSLIDRRLVSVDIDNFDEVLSRLAPEVHVPLSDSGAGVAVRIDSLDSFSADRLYDQLEVFASLRAARRRLLNPDTFAAESERWRPKAPAQKPPAEKSAPAAPPPQPVVNEVAPLSGAGLLDQVLSQPSEEGAEAAQPSVRIAGIDLGQLINEVVAPFVLPKKDPQQNEYVAAVDEAATALLRNLLHAPAFQQLEAGWRQLWRVTKALTREGRIRVFLLDATRAELAADLSAAGAKITQSGLYRLLIGKHGRSVDQHTWGAFVVMSAFGRSSGDCQLLASLGAVATSAGGPILADARAEHVGLAGWEQAADREDWQDGDVEAEQRWAALRTSPLAPWIGLAAPRPLVRPPYGATNATEKLAFDELGPDRPHGSFLWGSAALACAELIGAAYCRDGAAMRLGKLIDLEDLPMYVFDDHGEKMMQPCAEVFLSDKSGEALQARGIMPLLSYKDRPTVRVAWFGSIAPGPLGGPWSA